jgi:hydrogenase maturation protease
MNQVSVDQLVHALMYEGYMLYPYRPSVKNHQRWTFGGLYPPDYCKIARSGDAAGNQTECLVKGNAETSFDISVRFLHLIGRAVGQVSQACETWNADCELPFQFVESLQVGEETYQAWQETQEGKIDLMGLRLDEVSRHSKHERFAIPARRWCEPLRHAGLIKGVLVRRQEAIEGDIEIAATAISEGVFKVTLRIANQTPMPPAPDQSRDVALARSLLSTYSTIAVHEGQFISMIDPPEFLWGAAVACRNQATWPVLVGEDGATDVILSSPIILYDYPRLAPESPGDLFDGTEIDEILTLRILTLTEEEKRAGAALDERSRLMLARTERLAREQLAGLHGTVRQFRPLEEVQP